MGGLPFFCIDGETMSNKEKTHDWVRYLWDDLNVDEQTLRLQEVAKKLAKKERQALIGRLGRYMPFQHLEDFHDDIEELLGLQLDDDWLRMCAIHKFQGLIFYSLERYEANYLSCYSKAYKATQMMKEWPRRARSKTNPWKNTSVIEVQPLPIIWFEEIGQYRVQFQFDRGVTQTFWFLPDFRDSSFGPGWIRPIRQSKYRPWVNPKV